jgi:hypothetical protein
VQTNLPIPADSVYTLWLELETLDGGLRWVQSRFRRDTTPAILGHRRLEPVLDGEDRPPAPGAGFRRAGHGAGHGGRA